MYLNNRCFEIGIWNLFVIWYLKFGILKGRFFTRSVLLFKTERM